MAKTDISDGICAYLQGGLGNQLFIYAAAYAQSKRLGCELFVDVSKYSKRDPLDRNKETSRNPELLSLGLPGTVIDRDSPWWGNSPRRPSLLRVPGTNSRKLEVFCESRPGYDPAINSIVPGTTLYGYFQTYKNFQEIQTEIQNLFSHITIAPAESFAISELTSSNVIHAHVRRGDYIDPKIAAHHGIASVDYFARSQQLMFRLLGNSTMNVFTDSPDLVVNEFQPLNSYSLFDDSGLSTFGAIRALAAGSALIMSNSSFSWWAAWLMSIDSSKPVIAPRPWQTNGSAAADLLKPEWITLDAR